MPSSITFTGSGFFVESAQSRSPGVVRIFYSNVPLASNPAGAHDALNPANYTLSGPGPGTVVSVAPVSGNAMAFDLTTSVPLHIGTWTVTTSNIEDVDTSPMEAPFAAVFTVTVLFSVPTLSQGAVNDPPDQIIRKHLSQAMKGPNWDALILALSTGDDTNWQNAQSAFDQLFVSTASGSWLEKRANDEGIQKPTNVGMADELFRQYVIKFSTSKVVHESIREILEVFYGRDAERAFVESAQGEPYDLSANPDLSWTLDEKEVFTIVFNNLEFNQPSKARAVEVAAVLTDQMQLLNSDGFAIPFTNPQTGETRVRIYSGSLGLGSFARVTGGMAQNIFQFPSLINTYSGTVTGVTGYNWVYTNPTPTTTRATLTINTGLGSPLITLSPVNGDENDYVIITSNAGIGVTGTFPVENVLVSYSGANLIQSFDIPRIAFTGTALQLANDAYAFYQPTKNSIFAAGSRTVLVAQPGDGRLDISLPATTQAVNRGPKEAFYGRLNPAIAINTIQRAPGGTVSVITASPHGLHVGQQVVIDGFQPKVAYPTTGAGQTSVSPYQATASWVNIVVQSANAPTHAEEFGAACTLSNGQVLFAGGTVASGGASTAVCNRFHVTGSATFLSGDEANGSTQWSYEWLATASLNLTRQSNAISPYGTGALTTGGFHGPAYTNTVEKYDPVGNTWTTVAAMNGNRSLHSQLTLLNGEVLVAGGISTSGLTTVVHDDTETYDGTSWTVQGNLSIGRYSHQMVQLSTGKVLVIGGFTDRFSSVVTNTVEVSTDNGTTWTIGPPMTYGRAAHKATLLPGDYVLVTGGNGYDPTNSSTLATMTFAEIYDPNTNRWYPVQSAGVARQGHVAIYSSALNQVLVAGGNSTGSDDCTFVEAFDVATRKWKLWPSKLSVVRQWTVGSITPSGLIPVMGGDNAGTVYDTVSILIPGSPVVSSGDINGQFVITATPFTNQFQYSTADRDTGLGYTSNFGTPNVGQPVAHLVSAQPQTANDPGPYLYDPLNGVSITDISSTTSGFVLSKNQQYSTIEVDGQGQFPDQQGWIVIGFGTPQQTIPIKLLGSYADTPTTTKLMIDYTYVFASTFPIGSNVTLLSQRGAFVPAHPEQVGSAYITDSSAGRRAAIAAIDASVAAGFETSIRIVYPGDRGLGGEGFPTFDFDPKLSDIVEIYSGDNINADENAARAEPPSSPPSDRAIRVPKFPPPEVLGWTLGPTMLVDRIGPSVVRGIDGRIFVAGGDSGGAGGPTQTISTQALAADGSAFSHTANLNVGRSFAPAVRIATNNRILVVGGNSTLTAEVYNPTLDSWTLTDPYPAWTFSVTALNEPGIVSLPSVVLVCGGHSQPDDSGNQAISNTNVWDPNTGHWTAKAFMNRSRFGHGCVLLPNGKVLAAGGYYFDGEEIHATAFVEIYDPIGDTWTEVSPMNAARVRPLITVLNDGTVLVAGGHGDRDIISETISSLNTAEVYDVVHDTWTLVGNMAQARANTNAVLIPSSGKVVAFCGQVTDNLFTGKTYTNHAEIYNPFAQNWISLPDAPVAIGFPRCALVGTGTFFDFGGDVNPALYLPTNATYSIVLG